MNFSTTPPVSLYHPTALVEVAGEELADLFVFWLLGRDRREADEIGEQDGDEAPLCGGAFSRIGVWLWWMRWPPRRREVSRTRRRIAARVGSKRRTMGSSR